MVTGSGSSLTFGGMKNEEDMKKLVVLTALILGLAACNTVEGLGQDVSAGARAVDRAI